MKPIEIFKQKRFRLIAGLLLFLGVIVSLRFLSPKRSLPQVLNTSPKNEEKQVTINQKIILTLNQEPAVDEWQVQSFPEFEFQLQTEGNQLKIVPVQYLKFQTLYRLEFKNQAFKGFYYQLSFTTEDQPIAGLGDPTFFEREKQLISDNYPLLKYVPHQDTNFRIDYLEPLTLVALLEKDTPAVRKEVTDWISSKRVDPSTHQILWRTKQ